MKYAKIGGQAVLEGVMMRYGNDYAVTVRKPDGTLEVKKDTYVSLVSRLHLKKVPIVRGVFAFIDSMILGISTLTYSASFYGGAFSCDRHRSVYGAAIFYFRTV